MIGRHLFKCLVVTSAALTIMLGAAVSPAAATTPAGWIDTTYGVGGVANVPGGALFGATIVDGAGRALVLGAKSPTGNADNVTRLQANGQVDTTFATSGTFTLPAAVFYTRLTVDANGLIYLLGGDAASGSQSQHFIVTRLTAGGAIDSSFAGTGTATIALPNGVPLFTSNAFAVRNDGDIVISFITVDPTKRGFLAALTPGGQMDTTFGPQGSGGMFALPNNQFIFKLVAAAAPVAPVFTASSPSLSAIKGVAYSYTFAATGHPAPTFSVGSGALPTGLTLNATTGVLSGTPSEVKSFTFTVTASNGVSPDASAGPFTITVAPTQAAPAFTAATPPATATVNSPYTFTFTATGSPAPAFTVASGALPTGLSLNSNTGVLSGTPTAAGPFTFTVKAANGVSPDAVTGSLTITVAPPPAAPVFTAASPPTTGVKGAPYSYTFTASGNPAPTFSLASGALPPGLTLSPAGVLAGNPTATGSSTFSVKAANGVSPDAVTGSLTITVSNAPFAPFFTADSPPTTATVGRAYSYTFVASGNPAPSFTVAGRVPTGLTLDPVTGVLSGTPTAAHSFSFRVVASNGVSPAAVSPLITIDVLRAPAGAAGAAVALPAEPVRGTSATPSAAPTPAVAATPAAAITTTTVATTTTTGATTTTTGATTTTTGATTTTVATTTTTTVPPPPPVPAASNDVVALLASDVTSTRTFVLQRYTSNGSLDTTFGTGGSTAVFPSPANPSAIAEAPDSSYYITGNDGQAVFLAHVTSSGQFDAAFGTAGVLVGPVESCKPTGGQVLLDGANIYVLAIDADINTCGVSPAIVLRFHGGAIDTTFGASGEVRIDSVASFRVRGPNGGGLGTGGRVLVGMDGAAAPATSSAAVTSVNPAATGPAIEGFTQLVDDSHFAAGVVAPNPSGTFLGPLGATLDGTGTTHVFAQGANHHLFEFKQTGPSWAAGFDVTAATTGAPAIASAPKAFFDGTTIDVFALASNGDLVEYQNNGPSGGWTTADINAQAQAGAPKVTGLLDPHAFGGLTPIYGVTVGGDLVEIDNDHAGGHLWNMYDLSVVAGGGGAVAGGPGAVVISGIPHVYARAGANNHLVEYIADHAGNKIWNAYDLTTAALGGVAVAGTPAPVVIAGTPHVYVAAASGDLMEFVADHLNNSIWNAYDQTASANAPKPVGNFSVVLIDGTPYGIASLIPEVWETVATGDLTNVVADHQAGHVWNIYDATALSGGPQITGDPTPLVTPSTVQVFGLGKASSTAAAAVAPSRATPRAPEAPTFPSLFLSPATK